MKRAMRMVLARRRQSGVLLLTVALLLAIMAALAFSLNRTAGIDAQAVAADYERRKMAYLAEAAFEAAKWRNQVKCGNEALPSFQLAGATLSASVDKTSQKQINVTATATMMITGITSTLTRQKVDIFDLGNTETKQLGGAVLDTYVSRNAPFSMDGSDNLVLSSDQSNVLLYWPTTDIPGSAEVLSALLTLTQNGGSSSPRTVDVHRMTAEWDDDATWFRPRPFVLWSGGDYKAQVEASVDVTGAGKYTWELTNLVSAWYNDPASNDGMLLRLPNPGQSVTFYSRDSGNQRPVLNVTFAKRCN